MAHLKLLRPTAAVTSRLVGSSIRGSSHICKQTKTQTQTLRHHSSVSANELSHFSGLANSWWDPMGPSRVLHLMNPTRHDFIASCLSECEPKPQPQTQGLRYLDVGCGGGIFAESLARTLRSKNSKSAGLHPRTKAGSIVAIDPSTSLITIACDHASNDPAVFEHLRSGAFSYENTTIEALSQSRAGDSEKLFDVITLFEVIEHVDPNTSASFLTHCLKLLQPGGWLIGSTIARTIPSFVVNKMVAEAPWPVGVVPWGTHEWSKFVNADEMRGWVEEGLMRAADGAAYRAGGEALMGMKWKVAGVVYVPGLGWKMVQGGEDWGNYFWAVQKGV